MDGSPLPTCVVCLEPIQGAGQAKLTGACGHAFHYRCIQPWAGMQGAPCPMCRSRTWLGPGSPNPPLQQQPQQMTATAFTSPTGSQPQLVGPATAFSPAPPLPFSLPAARGQRLPLPPRGVLPPEL